MTPTTNTRSHTTIARRLPKKSASGPAIMAPISVPIDNYGYCQGRTGGNDKDSSLRDQQSSPRVSLRMMDRMLYPHPRIESGNLTSPRIQIFDLQRWSVSSCRAAIHGHLPVSKPKIRPPSDTIAPMAKMRSRRSLTGALSDSFGNFPLLELPTRVRSLCLRVLRVSRMPIANRVKNPMLDGIQARSNDQRHGPGYTFVEI